MTVDNCYNCNSADSDFYAEENGYTLVKCKGCGLLYIRNRPDEHLITEASKQGKHKGDNELDVTGHYSSWKIPAYLKVLKDLFPESIRNNATWLDVGCGYGEFIEAVQRHTNNQIRIIGSEPNRVKQEFARKRNLQVSYFDLESHDNTYDYISLLNVYSHLPDPPGFISSLKKMLNPSGELVIETGDTAHLAAKDHIKPYYLPDHLSFASEKIVTDILKKLGFDILSVQKYPVSSSNLVSLVRETAKAFLPGYKSRLKYMHSKKYSAIDMYIRARIR